MPAPQPGPVINLLLIVTFGISGWFTGTLSKPVTAARPSGQAPKGSAPAARAGDYPADVRRYATTGSAGAADLDSVLGAYGAGSSELSGLAALVMERWAASDAAAAFRDGIPRCAAGAPDALPRAFAAVAGRPGITAAAIIKALPPAPLRAECLTAAAHSWGAASAEDALTAARSLSRGERTIVIREWHRSAPEAASPSLEDADDRSAALLGRLLSLAAKDPSSALSQGQSHEDFAIIAAAAFREWVLRHSAAAWQAAESWLTHPRLPAITCALIKAEAELRPLADMLPELQSGIERLHPAGPPDEVLQVLLPALASERPQAAQKYLDSLPAESPARHAGSVILFDSLRTSDPAAAWRLCTQLLQSGMVKDHLTAMPWPHPAAHTAAPPLKRWEAGFPCLADVRLLLQHWMQVNPEESLKTFLSTGQSSPLQTAAIEIALSPLGGSMPPEALQEWSAKQNTAVKYAVETVLRTVTPQK